jgi:excisionase family DNA binding protein
MNTEYLTPAQVAEALSVHPVTVRKWISTGALPVERVGRRVLVAPGDVERLRAARGASEPEAAAQAPPRPRDCLHCGNPIPAEADPRALYCSSRCRWAAVNARKRERNPPERGPGRPPKEIPKLPPVPVPDRLAAAFAKASPPGRTTS